MSMSGIDFRPRWRSKEVVLDRVDVRDLEAVGDQRTGRAAAAGPTPIPCVLAKRMKSQTIRVVREPHLADRLQLELEPLLELGRLLPIALPQPPLAGARQR